jgi:hypothetical protein
LNGNNNKLKPSDINKVKDYIKKEGKKGHDED